MPTPSPLSPHALGDTLHQAALNLGITSVPGLTPAATIVLLYATIWFVPFLLCLVLAAREFTGGWSSKYREGGLVGITIGAAVAISRTLSLALYLLAAASVVIWARPDLATAYPAAKACVVLCTQFWSHLFPSLSATWHQAPIATLGCAIMGNIAAGTFAGVLAWPYRIARERRTRLLLSQLEAQQSPGETRRGTVRYL